MIDEEFEVEDETVAKPVYVTRREASSSVAFSTVDLADFIQR